MTSLRLSPPPLRTADGHSLDRRRASWVELFFDLVFVGAVNQLAGTLQDHPSLATLAHSVLGSSAGPARVAQRYRV